MGSKNFTPETVDQYISGFPKEIQSRLKEMRSLIKKVAPKADERISYSMPSYTYKGLLVYFAGYKNHTGFYPMPDVITEFKKEISQYKNAKGSVQFPHNEKLPVRLITKMIKFRMKLNEISFKEKKAKK